jgi:hypothetical protein
MFAANPFVFVNESEAASHVASPTRSAAALLFQLKECQHIRGGAVTTSNVKSSSSVLFQTNRTGCGTGFVFCRSSGMKALAREIARLSRTTPEVPTPSMCSLYRYLVRFYDDEDKAMQALEEFLNGDIPEIFALPEEQRRPALEA